MPPSVSDWNCQGQVPANDMPVPVGVPTEAPDKRSRATFGSTRYYTSPPNDRQRSGRVAGEVWFGFRQFDFRWPQG